MIVCTKLQVSEAVQVKSETPVSETVIHRQFETQRTRQHQVEDGVGKLQFHNNRFPRAGHKDLHHKKLRKAGKSTQWKQYSSVYMIFVAFGSCES